ncbi:MAG: CHAT domain-containing protein, partial [Gammaproteobacteria bacterium]|nr:CHAT domain-containing protein [Gammaproteobacteria bacterium]
EAAVADSGIDAEHLEITFLEQPVTLSALEAELKKGYHILHLVAHGMFLKEDEQAFLFLANNENQVDRVSDDDFTEMLSRSGESLRLVFLASCQTATRSSADAFRGFAPKLVAAGVPAVLAMQDLVPINTAREFAATFYRQLIRHGQVDVASNEARSAVLTAKLSGASIPVLFMRLRSGTLFGQRGQILGDRADSFWNTLLDNIADGECTPFLGPGVTQGLLPDPD